MIKTLSYLFYMIFGGSYLFALGVCAFEHLKHKSVEPWFLLFVGFIVPLTIIWGLIHVDAK